MTHPTTIEDTGPQKSTQKDITTQLPSSMRHPNKPLRTTQTKDKTTQHPSKFRHLNKTEPDTPKTTRHKRLIRTRTTQPTHPSPLPPLKGIQNAFESKLKVFNRIILPTILAPNPKGYSSLDKLFDLTPTWIHLVKNTYISLVPHSPQDIKRNAFPYQFLFSTKPPILPPR